jgi:hypothetical protein
MAIEIQRIPPLPITQLDRAPKPASRVEPESIPAKKLEAYMPPVERRRDPERRRRRRAKDPLDRRLGAERRRNSIDIEV